MNPLRVVVVVRTFHAPESNNTEPYRITEAYPNVFQMEVGSTEEVAGGVSPAVVDFF
ncbi:hypothetical protein DPMN_044898 [Dreissena polymorpha]|uniref:Uncharacterized protein n=1 Tax=Dreissena polymorpha TaxID=45954 RepID=A0A9D4D505_DREPO|nr:hypothetical protein DPMN_044898 [Dreissena polymorpha]